jgi:hypothetical protein
MVCTQPFVHRVHRTKKACGPTSLVLHTQICATCAKVQTNMHAHPQHQGCAACAIFVPGKPGGSPPAAAASNVRLLAPTCSATLNRSRPGHVRRYAFPRCSSHEPSHYRSIRRAFEGIGCRVVGSRKAGRASYGRRLRRLDLSYFGRRRKGDAANRFGPRKRPVLAAGGLAHGCVLALTGKASDAIQILTSAITTWRATGSTCCKRANCWLRFTGGSLRALARAI